jgi:hypothetical protein
MTLNQFKEKAEQYLTNNISAMMGHIQLTSNERAELKKYYLMLSDDDKKAAEANLREKGV